MLTTEYHISKKIKSGRNAAWVLFMGILITCSCNKDEPGKCLKSTGTVRTEKREHTAFKKIHLQDNINLFIKEGPVYDVKIEAGEKLLPYITTSVQENELRIENRNRCNWLRSYKVPVNAYITLPDLDYIFNNGQGTVRCTDTIRTDFDYETKNSSGDYYLLVNTGKVTGHMHGSADVYISGRSAEHAVHFVGNGFVNAYGLQTDYTWLWSNTTGEMYVSAKNLLIVSIHNYGNVFYRGSPVINKSITGKGSLQNL